MKIKIILVVLLFTAYKSVAQEFKFESEIINYGKITQDDSGERTFKFRNIGNAPLFIKDIKTSCGCAVPKKPRSPTMPGETGEIIIAYDTTNKGAFSKAITVFSNAKTSRKLLKIKGFVIINL